MQYSFIVLDPLRTLSAERLREKLTVLRVAGYAGVELNLTEPSGVDLDDLQSLLTEFGLCVPSFLTGEAYSAGFCLSSPERGVRTRTTELLIRYLDVAARFRSVLVIGLLRGLRSDEADPQVAEDRIVESLRPVAEMAESKAVELVVEPVNHLQVGFHNSVAEVRHLIERIGSASLRPMVDTIHMNIEERSLTQPIIDSRRTLRHVHLCESNGGRFGTGLVDFLSVLSALRQIEYDGFCSVKVYRHIPFRQAAESSLAFLRSLES
jgi:sugar phosphate isomerase/epimerase